MLKEADAVFSGAFCERIAFDRNNETLIQSFQRANREVQISYCALFLKDNQFSSYWSARVTSNPEQDQRYLPAFEGLVGRFDQIVKKEEALLRLLPSPLKPTTSNQTKVFIVPVSSEDYQDAVFVAVHQRDVDYQQTSNTKYILHILYHEFAELSTIPTKTGDMPTPLGSLETRALKLRANGLDVVQVAEIMGSPVKTVEQTLKGVIVKLHARDLVSAVAKAARYGIIE